MLPMLRILPTLRAAPLRPAFGSFGMRTFARSALASIYIQTESTPNSDSLKFIPGTPVAPKGSREFVNKDEARSSPLASQLFTVPGVESLFFGPNFISVNKDPEVDWMEVKQEVFALMMEHFQKGEPALAAEDEVEQPEDLRILDSDSEVEAMIKELLETRVRPAIMDDGGDLKYLGFDERTGIVQVSLRGSCRGCSLSATTLKDGIERMMQHYVPEVEAVEAVDTPEQKVANDVFSQLEQRLRSEGKTV